MSALTAIVVVGFIVIVWCLAKIDDRLADIAYDIKQLREHFCERSDDFE